MIRGPAHAHAELMVTAAGEDSVGVGINQAGSHHAPGGIDRPLGLVGVGDTLRRPHVEYQPVRHGYGALRHHAEIGRLPVPRRRVAPVRVHGQHLSGAGDY